ncbi:MAG: tetratricopeptide repeat protein [Gammaproteobacteria bacterium]|nr:tetratricopeptide repeat protein [Gammaproteobacteria bacterium]
MRFSAYVASAAALLVAACTTESEPPPVETGPAEFIGSVECADCHESEHRDWQGSHHELAMQVANESTVLGDFSDAEFDYYGKKTQFTTRNDEYFVRTENADGEEQDFRVAYTFGVTPLQQYLVEFPGGRMQALPYAWDSRDDVDGGQRWYHLYPDEYIEPGDELHWTGRLQNWNYMCAECHSTNLVMAYDAETKTYDTTYSELSVGCEACHGPGSEHRDQAVAGTFDNYFGLPVDLDDNRTATWVMNPDTGIAERSNPATTVSQQPESCGRCHSRRGVIATDYEYGKPLADTHRLALLDEYLYFADGQIKDEVYVYGSFVQSRMYQAGVTCSDCHNPHSGELHTGSNPNDVCAQCHLTSKFATIEHSRHEPVNANCVDCHMVPRTYMGVDQRPDHSFRIPRPDLSVEIGTPNACNGCHWDQSATWAAAEIAKWLGTDIKRRPHIGTIIAAGRAAPVNAALAEASANKTFPAIGRATALTLLAPPFADAESRSIANALDDPDPLIRTAALRALQLAPAETRLRMGAKTLDDPLLSVRLAAAPVYADLRDLLPAAEARAFGHAAEEYRATNTMLANTPEALANLGQFELSMGDVNQALGYFGDALDLEPGNALLRHSMGLVLVRAGDHDEALQQLRRAYELEPTNPRYVFVYGVALNSLGLNDDALTLLQNARQEFPADFDIGWAVATMLRDTGDIENARSVATELAKQFPDDANIEALRDSLGPN